MQRGLCSGGGGPSGGRRSMPSAQWCPGSGGWPCQQRRPHSGPGAWHSASGRRPRPALQQCPERLDAVGMGLASHILAGAVAHALVAVLGHALAGPGLIGEHLSASLHLLVDKALKGATVSPSHAVGHHLACGAVLGPCHRGLARWPPALLLLAPGMGHVLALPA